MSDPWAEFSVFLPSPSAPTDPWSELRVQNQAPTEPNFFAQFDKQPAGDAGSGPLVVTVAPRRQGTGNFFDQFDKPAASAGGNYFDRFDPPPKEKPSNLMSAARGAMQGLTFGLADESYGVTQGVAGLFNGEGFGAGYDRGVEEYRARDRAAKEAHPISSTVGEVSGSIPPIVAGGLTSLGAKALGLTGRTFLGRSAASTGSGAVIGGVQGFNSGEGDVENRLSAAGAPLVTGAVVGSLSPAVGLGVGRLTQLGREFLGGRAATIPAQLGSRSADMLAQDINAAGGPQAVRGRLAELGRDATLIDVSPSLQGRAQGLATQPETRDIIMAPLKARDLGTNARLRADVDANLGPAPIPSRIEAGLDDGRRVVGDLYEPLFQNAPPIRAGRLAETLDRMAVTLKGDTRRAVVNARKMLDAPGRSGVLDENPRALFNVRQELDGLMEIEKNSKVLAQLGFVRQAVDDYLRAALPGNKAAGITGIKDVDAQFHELMRQSEGLNRGSQVLARGKTAIRPDEMAEEAAAKAIPQGEMIGPSGETFRIRQGMRADIDRNLGTNSNDLVTLRREVLSEGDWNQPKIGELYTPEKAAKVAGAIDRERTFRDSYNKVVEGSQTDMRAAARKGVEPRAAGEGAGSLNDVGTGVAAVAGGPTGAAINLGVRGVRLSANQIARAGELARNDELAHALVTRQGKELDLLIETIENRIGIKAAGEGARDKAAFLAQMLTQAQGYQASKSLPAGWRQSTQ